MFFHLIYSTCILLLNYNSNNNLNSKTDEIIDGTFQIKLKNAPNIYFFIIDAMMPLDKYEDFYGTKLNKFRDIFSSNGFSYYKKTLNIYDSTADNFTALFFLDEIYNLNFGLENKKLKSNIPAKYPSVLKDKYKPKLIYTLNQLGYEFKWLGNIYANCSRYNYKYCLSNKKENYIDFYLLQAFLKKTPVLQIFNIITEFEIIKKNINFNNKIDSINKFNEFIISNNDYLEKNRPSFFFLHDLQTHWPYIVDSNCNYKRFRGKLNIEGYKNSYLCAVKKISKIIKTINKFDNNAIIVFQSDHNWEMALNSEEKFGNRKEIFNLIKFVNKCDEELAENFNNIKVMKYIVNCIQEN